MTYWYAGKYLGGRLQDQICYRGRDLDSIDYEEVDKRDWFKTDIDQLISKAEVFRTVVMCSEEDPNRCHRHHLIAKTLVRRGIRVLHIRGNGSLEEAIFEKSLIEFL